MYIIVSPEWLKACGRSDLAGVPLKAELVESKSWSAMGNYFDVILPSGALWGVFSTRGITVVADPFLPNT